VTFECFFIKPLLNTPFLGLQATQPKFHLPLLPLSAGIRIGIKMGAQSDLQIAQPLTLKCGLTLPNRLVKAAMAEQMAGTNQLPDERLQAIYKHWSTGGWGLIITGTSPFSHHPP
jgi:hypothetical protein